MKNALFIWIPRTAGTSVYFALWKKAGAHKKKNKNLYRKFKNKGVVSFGHVGVSYLLRKEYISREFFDSAYKFCFVRNPWDRLVSLYNYFSRNCNHVTANRTRARWGNKSFKDFCIKLDRQWETINPVGRYNLKGVSQCNPQVDWILDGDKVMPDFIGRFENLEKDFQHIANEMGIDMKLTHKNKTKHKEYRYYYNPKTRDIVARLYKKDIDMFDYSF